MASCGTGGGASTSSNSSSPSSESSSTNSNSKNVIGIIGAMDEEVELLKNQMKIKKETNLAGMTFYEGELSSKNIVLVRSGIGKVNAASCAQILITKFGVSNLINSGVSGSMNPDLNQGDIVISTDTVQHDFDETALGRPVGEISRLDITFFKSDEKLISAAEKAGESLTDIKVIKGRIASGDQFIAGGDKYQKIKTNFNPQAVEMEGGAIGHVAYLNKIPYVVIRSISDKADGEAPLSFEEFVKMASKNASDMIEKLLLNLK
ncbi:MAG: 5'-methylthioadenosine/adenosylhomocysteine nucleosidase [Oscillospiraceae bacterium]|nr:5'-methylthioadenosine/adenosylhomocysteine nucleosidase [Oscillospiraceae bacterium]